MENSTPEEMVREIALMQVETIEALDSIRLQRIIDAELDVANQEYRQQVEARRRFEDYYTGRPPQEPNARS